MVAMKACNKCGQQIDFKKLDSGKWKPVNPDGTDHKCQASNNNRKNGTRLQVIHESDTELVLKIGEYRLDIRKEAK